MAFMSADVELRDLVKQFQRLQYEEAPSQITERNVVEIVNTLQKQGFIQVLFTTDAKEYLTWDELRKEIMEEVCAGNGRLNVVDLPGLLSVHAHQVECALPEVLRDNPGLQLENGELITQQYLESIVQITADALREEGSLSISQFAVQHRFSSAFALDVLTRAVHEGRLRAVIQDSALYTQQFVASQKIIVRSGLFAVTQPLDLLAFYKRHKLFLPLMDAILAELRDELPGTYSGHTYIPAVFDQYRTSQLENIYNSNGFVEYTTLQRLGITAAKQYLMNRYNPTGAEDFVVGTTAAVASLPTQPAPQRRGGKKRTGAKSIQKAVKEALTPLMRASEQYPMCGYALSSCFMSDRYIAKLMTLQSAMDNDLVAVDATHVFPACIDLSKDWVLLEPRLRELYPGIERYVLIGDTVLLRDDALVKTKASLMKALTSHNDSLAVSDKSSSELVSEEVILNLSAEALQLPIPQYDSPLREIVDYWGDAVGEIVEQAKAVRKNRVAADAKETRQFLVQKMSNAWVELGVIAKGLQWVKAQLDESIYITINRNVLGGRAYELCKDVLLNESLDQAELHARVTAVLDQISCAAALRKILAPFPESMRATLNSIIDVANGKELHLMLETLQDLSGSGAIAIASFHAPNKKLERETYAKMMRAVVTEARMTAFGEDAACNGKIFATLCSLLLHLLFHVYVEVPGKTVSTIVARLEKEPEAPTELAEIKQIIVSSLQCNEVSTENLSKLNLFREQVLGRV